MDIFNKDDQEFMIKSGKPVLLIGPHGVGKTSVLRSISTNFGLKMHELNAATLDPFVHIVGIPVVNEGKVTMNPPDELFNAELLFIDEVNRADRPTRNALFELICDHSVNGKPLPNLKLIVGAMNPPDEQYHVDALDIAMDDRFLYKFNVGRDITWALAKLPKQEHREVVSAWYKALEEPPSPRRLTWVIESAFNADGTINEPALLNALDDTKYGTKSLLSMLSTEHLGSMTPVADTLLTEDEKRIISNVLALAITDSQWNGVNGVEKLKARKTIRSSFINGADETYLPIPDGAITKEDATTFNNSEEIKKIDALFPYSFSVRNDIDWTLYQQAGDKWLDRLLMGTL